jgi:hypothetical protein
MSRNMIIALFAIAVVGTALPSVASARGGHGGSGGFHGGSFHGGGFHGGGFRRDGFRGFRGGGFGAYYGIYGYPYGYGSYSGESDNAEGCYLVRQRVMTQYGWRLRQVQACG